MEKKMSSHAAAAIRAELKKAFPAVTFQVRSESYSMGDSVRIHWQDGPTVERVGTLIYRMLRRMDLTGGFDSTYPPKQ